MQADWQRCGRTAFSQLEATTSLRAICSAGQLQPPTISFWAITGRATQLSGKQAEDRQGGAYAQETSPIKTVSTLPAIVKAAPSLRTGVRYLSYGQSSVMYQSAENENAHCRAGFLRGKKSVRGESIGGLRALTQASYVPTGTGRTAKP